MEWYGVASFPTSERDLKHGDDNPPVTGTSPMVSLMGVHVVSSWLPPGMGHSLLPVMVLPKERRSQYQRFYHLELKLLDFDFYINCVLQMACSSSL